MKYAFLSEDPFASKVAKTEGCWEWTGGKTKNGYGQINVRVGDRRTTTGAHRAAYEIKNGDIPEGIEVDHLCHNRGCVNPDHLRLVTRKQNLENLGGLSSRNTSGYRGVTYVKTYRKWRGSVMHNRAAVLVGFFDTAEEANEAVLAKRLDLFTHNDLDRKAAS